MPIVVAIDGPAGAGKSTVAKAVAAALDYLYVDTGALYRGIGWYALEAGLDPEDEEAVTALARHMKLGFVAQPDGGSKLQVDGEDRSEAIRTPAVADAASKVSQYQGVRDALLETQRAMGAQGGVVLEGRDIGTVVFPNAGLKVYLTATAEVRANRRYADLLLQGHEIEYEALLRAIQDRDRRDTMRPIAPLREAADAVRIDSDHLDADAVVAKIVSLVHART